MVKDSEKISKLVLYPNYKKRKTYDRQDMIWFLKDIKFISNTFGFQRKPHFKAGKQFLDYVAFVGCSPVFTLTLNEEDLEEGAFCNRHFCHVSMPTFDKVPSLWGQPENLHPKCPGCKRDVNHWLECCKKWTTQKKDWQCPDCQHVCTPHAFVWKRQGGLVHFSIDIWGVHEGEAFPSDQLLTKLENHTRNKWDYFFSTEDPVLIADVI